MSTESFWDDESRVELLTKLWKEGLSSKEIARQLGGGITRNSVVSKASRIGLPRRNPKLFQERQVFINTDPPAPPSEPPPDPIPGAKTLADKEYNECSWPLAGRGAETLFCCKRRKRGSSYCDEHHDGAWEKGGKISLYNPIRGGNGKGVPDYRHQMETVAELQAQLAEVARG